MSVDGDCVVLVHFSCWCILTREGGNARDVLPVATPEYCVLPSPRHASRTAAPNPSPPVQVTVHTERERVGGGLGYRKRSVLVFL